MARQPRYEASAPRVQEETLDDFGADFDGGVLEMPPVSDAYPYDGRNVMLTADGATFTAAYWRKTRAFRGGRWDHQAFWAVRNSKTAIGFTPMGFKPFEEEPLLVTAPKGAVA